MTRKWSLSGRDRSEREQRETPGTVWEWIAGTGVIKVHSFMAFGDNFYVITVQTKLKDK